MWSCPGCSKPGFKLINGTCIAYASLRESTDTFSIVGSINKDFCQIFLPFLEDGPDEPKQRASPQC
jgi:hypothetical protein